MYQYSLTVKIAQRKFKKRAAEFDKRLYVHRKGSTLKLYQVTASENVQEFLLFLIPIKKLILCDDAYVCTMKLYK